MNNPLISIIIPTYNRYHLIGETIDSILQQNYTNWECIIIDDGSLDYTKKLLDFYKAIDSRIKFYKRTDHFLPGGNGARNYGLKLADGDYIIFFDSDDLMTINHLQVKVESVLKFNTDYCITRTQYINGDETDFDHYYNFENYDITLYNYIFQKINWLTYDTIIKASLAKSISFNEKLKTGQEYNYHSKLIAKSTNATFIDKTVTLRRKHENSKRGKLVNHEDKIKSSIYAMWLTYIDLEKILSKKTKRHILFRILDINFNSKNNRIPNLKEFKNRLATQITGGSILFSLMMFLNRNFNKGYFLRNFFKSKLYKA